MIKVDRIELADIGNSVEIAKALIDQIPDLDLPIPVREIAHAVDIVDIKPLTVSGFEGGLIVPDDKSFGSILINNKNSSRRQRFTIGHELGHYLNPWHNPGSSGQFLCTSRDMIASQYKPNEKRQRMEVEANQFSAELLMPQRFIQADIDGLKEAELDHISSLADKYDVSKESMGRRYIEYQDEPCALIFSRNGIVSYTVKSQYFPRLEVWEKGDLIPHDTKTRDCDDQPGCSSNWQEHASDVWLCDNSKYESLYEQVLIQENGYRITLLTLGEKVDEEEEELIESWTPRFKR